MGVFQYPAHGVIRRFVSPGVFGSWGKLLFLEIEDRPLSEGKDMSVYDIAVEANVSTQEVLHILGKLGVKNVHKMEEFSSVITPFAIMAIKELKK